MSTVYNLEPNPTAKVILHTTSGPLQLELFAQQTPLASRNFLQHCLDGYYDNTLFHRVVPGFVIQGGDPTGTGMGGASSFDSGTFADEFHSRLKFNRRGLLGMASTGKDENGSQFFLTLGKTDELTGRNTMFGRIEGDTIFNLVKMGEAELMEGEDGKPSERPMYPTRVTGAEILVNPFEDMVKKVPQQARKGPTDKETSKSKAKKKAAKGLLSFGGEGGDEEDIALIVKPKFNTKAVNGGKDSAVAKRLASDAMTERPRKRRATVSPSPPPSVAKSKPSERTASKSRSRSSSKDSSPEPQPQRQSALERTNAQIAALKASLQRNVTTAPTESTRKKTALESMIPSTATRGRRRKGGGGEASALGGAITKDERKALDNFNAFRKRLENASEPDKDRGDAKANGKDEVMPDINKGDENTNTGVNDEEATLCDLHFVPNCQSCRKWDEEAIQEKEGDSGDENDTGWMSHKLTFEKDRLGKDLEWKRQNEKELVVIDPREKAKELGQERKKKAKDRTR